MLRKMGMVSTLGLFVCAGCGLGTYVAATQAILNTTVIAALLLTGTAFPNLLEALRGVVPGL